jgi:multiple sugar transport system permease protein
VFTAETTFIGLKNYHNILTDSRSLSALWNSIWYAVFCTIFNTAGGLILAVLVNDVIQRRVSIFFRSIYFFPSLVGLTFVAVIWHFFFQTDAGVINYYLQELSLGPIQWLSSHQYSKISVLFLDVWKNSGLSMLLILSGLQSISNDVMEAAEIDGASKFRRFFSITFPLASPTIFFVFIMNMTGALRLYESALVLTNGGPGDSSLSIVMLIAEKSFTSMNYGQGTSLSMLLLILIGVVTSLNFWGSKKWVNYD